MIVFPDVSHWDADRGWVIPAGTPIVIAKVTQATTMFDTAYLRHRGRAGQIGARFAGYHWLNHRNTALQALWTFTHAGKVPLMIDAEDVPGNTGYNGPNTVGDIVGYALEYRRLGGIVNLAYLPHWYWQDHMGSPSLQPLVDIGLSLVSSNYSGRGGWNPYGGMSPVQWQYQGSPLDMNMYRGTVDQWWSMANGRNTNMGVFISLTDQEPAGGIWYSNFNTIRWMPTMDAVNGIIADGGAPPWNGTVWTGTAADAAARYGVPLDSLKGQPGPAGPPTLVPHDHDVPATTTGVSKALQA